MYAFYDPAPILRRQLGRKSNTWCTLISKSIKGEGKVVSVHDTNTYSWSRSIAPLILNLDTG